MLSFLRVFFVKKRGKYMTELMQKYIEEKIASAVNAERENISVRLLNKTALTDKEISEITGLSKGYIESLRDE